MEEVLGADTIEKLIKGGCSVKARRYPDDDDMEMYEIEGIKYPTKLIPPSSIRAMKTWTARTDDIFVLSYAKAGTTWTQEIVSAICNNSDLDKLNRSHTWYRVPFLEATNLFTSTEDIHVPLTHELVGQMSSPRIIKSHLPGHLLPPDVLRKKAKMIYVARNPKDLAVSFYHFHNLNPSMPSYKSWNIFFDDFHTGNVTYGPWWKHYLYYWNMRHEPNVLFLKFEDIKKDLKGVVQTTAHFLGYLLSDDVVERIVNHCTFENMKQNPMTNPDVFFNKCRDVKEYPDVFVTCPPDESTTTAADDTYACSQKCSDELTQKTSNDLHTEAGDEMVTSSRFMRKGTVGDWKDLFTAAQNNAMDELIRDKLSESGLVFEYDQN